MVRLRAPSGGQLALLAGIVAMFSTLAFVHDVTRDSGMTASLPSTPPQTATPPGTPSSTYTSDDRGFLNSSARCDGSLTAVAIARTAGSLVAICADPNGDYLYRGVRLSDAAQLNVPAETTSSRQFVARNEGVTYSLSTQQLVITAGDAVVRREPVIEYGEPAGHAG